MRVSPTALGSVASWDPIVVAAVERCRAASTAAQSFAGCPFLDQAGAAISSRIHFFAVHLPTPSLL